MRAELVPSDRLTRVEDPTHAQLLLRAIVAPEEDEVLSLYEGCLAVGASTEAHRHPERAETICLLEGEAEGLLEGETWNRLGPHACWHIPAGYDHSLRNVGGCALRFLLIHAAPE